MRPCRLVVMRDHGPRTPRIERLWWDLESLTWDDQLADATRRMDLSTTVGWITGLREKDRERVLDVGCGTGNYSIALARAGYDVTGIDVSPAMLRRARGKSADVPHPPHFLAADLHGGLGFPDGSFEWVVCVHVLQVIRSPQTFLQDVSRLLVRGGRLVLVATTARPRAIGARAPTVRRAAFSILKSGITRRSQRIHRYTAPEISALLAGAGFRDVEGRDLPGRLALVARR